MNDEARTAGLASSRLRGPRHSPWRRRRGRAPFDNGDRASRPPVYAALDLGTNNCRLLVARPAANGFRVVDAFSRIIRLGEGVSGTGRISAAAVDRALDALAVCGDKMRQRYVTRARLIATEACRAAANGPDFVARVQEEIGLELEIIDRETEALLAATGCTPLVDPKAETVILFDIGGGSSELVNMGVVGMPSGPPSPSIRAWTSLPLGVVTLAERHGGIKVDRDLFEVMVEEVAACMQPFAASLPKRCESAHLLGTSGTVTTIAGVHLALRRYDRRYVDGCWMGMQEISAVVDRLLAMSFEERAANPCIGPERADLVLAGFAILEAIRRAFPCERLRVADRGLREGMLVQMMRGDGVWQEAGGNA
ncbi:MAG: Ppx/GppA family phosphatase [Rhizobiales bacterium]|nr:Ppx/GppA family phosphatase [Hyphomicrobiales bacterium]